MASETAHPYDGQVAPGDAPQTRDLPQLTIRKLAVSSMSNNVYLLTCRRTNRSLLIDAADDWPAIAALIEEAGTCVDTIVTTHQHWDHVRALDDAVRHTGARTVAGVDDAPELPVPVDQAARQGDQVTVGSVTLDVIHLRGHTPGSIALAYRDPTGSTHLFSGDTLFPGGVGATTHFAYQSFAQLIDDVERRVFDVYDDSTWVYPGHGGDTTLGAERPRLPEWRARGW
ncbi:MBL fold metallo-hydrolase [Leekyejoonella antrihumi]|uniref:MBL fold metallo-hydrolase n=1 Tax=Leekyejoonella antrihumi TaxID=1660198 RepID=A0A563E4I7_9MICO|nr:MBL fold metallo-hydrolase [Leekyejoonella antrihumi]TWP37152.1 MBL fold metallo-hydrolase [Leekyejoonella antrihumi]